MNVSEATEIVTDPVEFMVILVASCNVSLALSKRICAATVPAFCVHVCVASPANAIRKLASPKVLLDALADILTFPVTVIVRFVPSERMLLLDVSAGENAKLPATEKSLAMV